MWRSVVTVDIEFQILPLLHGLLSFLLRCPPLLGEDCMDRGEAAHLLPVAEPPVELSLQSGVSEGRSEARAQGFGHP
jgi:hypothetical protein